MYYHTIIQFKIQLILNTDQKIGAAAGPCNVSMCDYDWGWAGSVFLPDAGFSGMPCRILPDIRLFLPDNWISGPTLITM